MGGWYFRGQHDTVKVQAVEIKQDTANQAAETIQNVADTKAGDIFHATVDAPVDNLPPLPSVQQPACPVLPKARSTPSAGNQPAAVRTDPPPSVVQPEWRAFEQSDVQSGHEADATVIYLQALLQKQYTLCGGK